MVGMIQAIQYLNGSAIELEHPQKILDLVKTTAQVRINQKCVMAEILCRVYCHLLFYLWLDFSHVIRLALGGQPQMGTQH